MRVVLAIAAVTFLLAPHRAWSQSLPRRQDDPIPPQVDQMYLKGLRFLASTQTKNGNWPDRNGSEPGVVGLCVMAFLAHGEDPNHGPYAGNIRGGIQFIRENQSESNGYIGSSMYNHGFATLALAEAYGQVNDKRLGPALKKAADLILDAQTKSAKNAWRYSPTSSDADTTVSGANLVALYAARNAGIGIPQASIDKALEFFKVCQSPDGGFGYTSSSGPNAPRTAIGALMFALAKKKQGERFKAAMNFLESQPSGGSNHYHHYFLYYASQTYFHASPKMWATWNAENLAHLKETQQEDGRWDGNFGGTFATAASLLSMALNYRYLPIYER